MESIDTISVNSALPLRSLSLDLRNLQLLGTTIVGAVVIYIIATTFYNVYFHPLSSFPGPIVASASILPYFYHRWNGTAIPWIKRLHDQYGETVRFSPVDLSFINPSAWKDINGHRTGGKHSHRKPDEFYSPGANGVHSLVSEPDDIKHGQTRRIFANAFSDRALRLQEPLILKHVNKLIDSISRSSGEDGASYFDIVRQYNWTTFDVMGDLTFGESLGMLDSGEYHPWVKSVFEGIRTSQRILTIKFTPIGLYLWKNYMPQSMREKMQDNFRYSADRVDRRLQKGSGESDIWNLVLEKGDDAMPIPQMHSNADLFMLAGTETTATLLSGLTYKLLKDPERMAKVVSEIRNIKTESELNLVNLARLPYLNACFEEGLRCYPPIAEGLPRATPEGGATIANHFVPSNTRVSVPHYVAYHSPLNFKDPDSFIPERWLPGTGYDTDRKDIFQPFSFGPRNCLGKNLAYHEMRIIFAKVMWHFDLSLAPENGDWDKQNTYIIWEKGPLLVSAKSVR